ncbi:MAG: ribosome biogenesis GTPase Der [Nitrospinota bacterium]
MRIPIVAIVGRPNAGKSTLFNRIVKKRVAIVDFFPGVTRDRNYLEVEFNSKRFVLIDTGGFEPVKSGDPLSLKMREQTELAVEEADSIIFLCDGGEGLHSVDKEIYSLLKRSQKDFFLTVNKIDTQSHKDRVYDYYQLGEEKLYSVSAEHNLGVETLLENVTAGFPESSDGTDDEQIPRVAIVGKPNTGKSTLVNRLSGAERMVVSEVAGTTRDSIDTLVQNEESQYLFVDTAGIRRKGRVSQKLEKFSVIMALKSINMADICILLIDAGEGVTEQDLKIGAYIAESGRSCLIAINKWDLSRKEGGDIQKGEKMIREKMKFLSYAPIIFLSAKTGLRMKNLFPALDGLISEYRKKIPTAKLNKSIELIMRRRRPPAYKGREVKIYYGAQVRNSPPTFMLYANFKDGITVNYLRYMQNAFRKTFGFEGTPVRFVIKNRKR